MRFVTPTKPTYEVLNDDGQKSTKNSIGMTLNLIPAGKFWMGTPDHENVESDEKPQHLVRITRPFYLGVYEVTQAQYQSVMANNPSCFSAEGRWKVRVAGQSTDRYPVENISWLDAIDFCNRLSEKEGKRPFYEIDGPEIRVPDWNGPGYRLPTEAEWEYACRANTSSRTRFSFGDNSQDIGGYAWFRGNSEGRTHPVGHRAPNGFGLYDMHGNVAEWCWDWGGDGYYKHSTTSNPTGPDGGPGRVTRSGAWYQDPHDLTSAQRGWVPAVDRTDFLGFRLARSAKTAPARVSEAVDGFVSLFNGRDLTGWTNGPWPASAWHVEGGVLIGSGRKFSALYSDRDDYRSFHLRAEVRVNENCNSGIYFRIPLGAGWDNQYETQIGGPHGALAVRRKFVTPRPKSSIPADQWFTIEVIAEGKHVMTKVDGATVADYHDKGDPSPRGRIALEFATEHPTRVQFRKIEIKEIEY